MSYATATDLRQWIDEAALVQLTDDQDAGTADEDIIESVLEAASTEIDGYLGGRYELPMAAPPAILKKLCVDIAGWLLHVRRDVGAPEHWQRRYDNAVRFLEQVAAGKITLGAGDPVKTTGSDTASITGPERLMGREGLKGW